MFGGVCGGLAEYFDIDPVIVRFAYVLLAFASNLVVGFLVYLLAWAIIPLEEKQIKIDFTESKKEEEGQRNEDGAV